jgi:hypothetical protein
MTTIAINWFQVLSHGSDRVCCEDLANCLILFWKIFLSFYEVIMLFFVILSLWFMLCRIKPEFDFSEDENDFYDLHYVFLILIEINKFLSYSYSPSFFCFHHLVLRTFINHSSWKVYRRKVDFCNSD